MLKKIFIILSIILFCSSCNKRTDSVELSFSSWGSITEVEILETVIKKYENEHKNIKINFNHIPQNYFQKLHLLFVAKQEPDVIFINNLNIPVFKKYLQPLTPYIIKEDYFPKSIDALSSTNEELYAAPRDISNLVFFYNKDKLGEISQDWTIQDLINLLEKHGDKKYILNYENNIYYAIPYILTFGGNIDDKNINSLATQSGISFYKKLEGKYAPYIWEVGSLTSAQLFLDGKLDLFLSGRWLYPKLIETAKFNIGVVNFPGIVQADASGWALSNRSKHKKEAIEFIKYLTSKETIDYFTTTNLIIPARIDSSKMLNSANDIAFINATKKSKALDIDKNYNKKIDKLNKKYFNN